MRAASRKIFYEIKRKGLLSEKRMIVYQVLFNKGPLTGTELAKILKRDYKRKFGKHSETVRNRLTELRDSGCVEEIGLTTCSISGRRVTLWDVTGKLPKITRKTRLERLLGKEIKLEIQLNETRREILKAKSRLHKKGSGENLSFFD